jgi:carbon-monoxide dehydrogenase large subunit
MESAVRQEDSKALRALRGRGRFIDDIHLPDEQHCCFLRSPVARGRIVRVETRGGGVSEATVFTAATLGLQLRMPQAMYRFPDQVDFPFPALAEDRVAFVGQPVAVALARSREAAEDAIDNVCLEIDKEPALVAPLPPMTCSGKSFLVRP